jgi:hypothetical protein
MLPDDDQRQSAPVDRTHTSCEKTQLAADSDRASRGQRSLFLLCGVAVLLATGLLVYSQTQALAWDEGFHLLAAQLIKAGKRPYLDFCFPQTPLNAYWNAGWMRIFGESWRTAHAIAALLTAGAILLIADFVFRRFRIASWRLPAALSAALIVGLNVLIVQFGTVGQAYALCLFLIVAAFRFSTLAVDRKGMLWTAAAGFLAAAAAGSSLLTAPVAPVLLLWMMFYNREGSRWRKSAAFLTGGVVPLLPLIWMFAEAPRQVIFNLFEYHLFYRRVEWEGATSHDLEVLTSWNDSSHGLILALLALAGLVFTIKNQPDRRWRGELYLCFWLTMALAMDVSSAHPTFVQYFVLLVPFLGVLASVGFYELASRMDTRNRPFWPLAVLTFLLCLGLAKAIHERSDNYTWQDLEAVARKVNEVSPANAPLLAEEHCYFLTRRLPPTGMELTDSQKLVTLPPAIATSLHILPRTELAKRVKEGAFSTVQTCRDDDDERFRVLGVPPLYRKKAVIQGCTIFWDRATTRLAK